jgi:tRNA (guanine-N7-)-methyltransferase
MAGSRGKNWTLSRSFAKSSDNILTESSNYSRRLWGRRMTRPLGKDRARAFENLYPLISIPEGLNKNTDPASFFLHPFKEHWLEIGFGNGEHLVVLKQQNPDTAFIGAEPFINGMAAFVKHIEYEPTDNIRVFMDDAMLLVENMADESFERIYVLNPDPWPKNRHAKRRILSQKNLDQFARVLKPGGLLLTCTDVSNLAEWMVAQLANHPAFIWTANNSKDWKNPPPDWASTTRYREKGAKAGRKMTFLIFRKA